MRKLALLVATVGSTVALLAGCAGEMTAAEYREEMLAAGAGRRDNR